MIAYIDTSALLRIVFREPGALEDLRAYDGLVSSELIAVESARTIDRLRWQGALTPEEAAARLRSANEWLEAIDLLLLRTPVLSRASDPLPMPLGTVDARYGSWPGRAGIRIRGARNLSELSARPDLMAWPASSGSVKSMADRRCRSAC